MGIAMALALVLAVLAETIVNNAATLADRIALGDFSPIDWVGKLQNRSWLRCG